MSDPATGPGRWRLPRGVDAALAPAAVLVIFLASRAFFWAHGIHFDASRLDWDWQFLDPLELRDHLARSIWYLHAQPPLFNTLLGLGLKTTLPPEKVFFGLFFVLGLALHLGLYAIVRLIGLPRWGAVTATAFFAWSPASILYESWLFYNYPAATFLVAGAVGLAIGAARGSRLGWALCFCALALAALTVAVFHVAWFVLCAGAAAWLFPTERRRIAAASAPWLAVLLGLYAKNFVLFGSASATSWFGMNFARAVELAVPAETLKADVEAGRLSPLSLIAPFSPLDEYPPAFRAVPRGTPRVPVLTQAQKADGGPNLNHIAFVRISKTYLRDDLASLRRHPGSYLSTCLRSWVVFFYPPSHFWELQENRSAIATYADAFDRWIYGVTNNQVEGPSMLPLAEPLRQMLQHAGLIWGVLTIGGCAFALWHGLRLLHQRGERNRGALILFLVGNILFVAVVGNELEYGENFRFRLMVEPFVVALIALLVTELARRGRAVLPFFNLAKTRLAKPRRFVRQ